MSSKDDFVDNVERRKWNLDDYARKARERLEQEELEAVKSKRGSSAVVKRAPLKRRDFDVELTTTLGKYQVITNSTPLEARGGYYCKSCECLLKDSMSYLDHINGKRHQRKLGMTMRPERATLSTVRERLQYHREKDEERKQGKTDIQKRLKEYEERWAEEEEERRAKRREDKAARKAERRKKRQEERAKEEEEEQRAAAAKRVKSSSSSSSDVNDEKDNGAVKSEEKKKKKKEDADNGGMDPAFAAMMGFASFGGSKKNN